MALLVSNSQEMRNALERKRINIGGILESDDFILIQGNTTFSFTEKNLDRVVYAMRQDGERIKDMRQNCTIGDIVSLL